ncbi:serine/threonine protein kinase [Candidatus Peregrinibacteria bacterium]|nr:serine/threonine protein kinase [Candidatus Peregrinibacteria bacterium]
MSASRCISGSKVEYGGMGMVIETHDGFAAKGMREELRSSSIQRGRFDDEMEFSLDLGDDPSGLFPAVNSIQREVRYDVTNGRSSMSGSADFIVMEKLQGKTLREHIDGTYGLGVPKVASIATQIAKALEVIHGRGLVHRDIKPDNAYVLPDGRVKVLDFDLASNRKRPLPFDATEGVLIGSPSYMGPECYCGVKTDPRSDQYGLGVIIWEALTGKRMIPTYSYESWIRAYGSIPFISQYDSMAARICSFVPSRHGDLVKHLKSFLSFSPQSKYSNLWLRGEDPMGVQELLRHKLDTALNMVKHVHYEDRHRRLREDVRVRSHQYLSPGGFHAFKRRFDSEMMKLRSRCQNVRLCDIVERLLAPDTAKRFSSAHEVAVELAEIAVIENPELRLTEPFYTLLGRATSAY